jgi:Peptidogalycan biosysnthesis/recognition
MNELVLSNESMLSVQFVASEAQISPSLWDACFPPPIEGRWWYQTLENSGLENQFTFAYGVIYEVTKPVGIAPIFFMNVPLSIAVAPWLRPLARVFEKAFPSLFCPRTLFVGSPGAEEGTVGLLPGVDQQRAFLCLQQSLEIEARRLRAWMIIWKDFPESYDENLNWLAREQRMFPLISFPSTVVALPTKSKEDYFRTLKSSRRNKLKKKIRLSAERVDVEIEMIQKPDGTTTNRIYDLYLKNLKKAAVTFEIMNRRFFDVVATQPKSYFVVMREKRTREVIAFMLCFDIEGRVIHKYIGIDYGLPRDWYMYFRLWDAAVDCALSRGASSIQSGQMSYEAKIEMGHTIVPLTNYCQHRNSLVHGIFRAIAKTISWQTLDDQLARILKAHPETLRATRS